MSAEGKARPLVRTFKIKASKKKIDIILYSIYPRYFQDYHESTIKKINPTKKNKQKEPQKKNKLIHIFKMKKENI